MNANRPNWIDAGAPRKPLIQSPAFRTRRAIAAVADPFLSILAASLYAAGIIALTLAIEGVWK